MFILIRLLIALLCLIIRHSLSLSLSCWVYLFIPNLIELIMNSVSYICIRHLFINFSQSFNNSYHIKIPVSHIKSKTNCQHTLTHTHTHSYTELICHFSIYHFSFLDAFASVTQALTEKKSNNKKIEKEKIKNV